jgi:hypothetical protein
MYVVSNSSRLDRTSVAVSISTLDRVPRDDASQELPPCPSEELGVVQIRRVTRARDLLNSGDTGEVLTTG